MKTPSELCCELNEYGYYFANIFRRYSMYDLIQMEYWEFKKKFIKSSTPQSLARKFTKFYATVVKDAILEYNQAIEKVIENKHKKALESQKPYYISENLVFKKFNMNDEYSYFDDTYNILMSIKEKAIPMVYKYVDFTGLWLDEESLKLVEEITSTIWKVGLLKLSTSKFYWDKKLLPIHSILKKVEVLYMELTTDSNGMINNAKDFLGNLTDNEAAHFIWIHRPHLTNENSISYYKPLIKESQYDIVVKAHEDFYNNNNYRILTTDTYSMVFDEPHYLDIHDRMCWYRCDDVYHDTIDIPNYYDSDKDEWIRYDPESDDEISD